MDLTEVTLDSVLGVSEDVVAREIEGELIIVPIARGVGDMEDDLYTLNETGKAIWSRLDGRRPLREIADDLTGIYTAPLDHLQRDVVGLVAELARRRMVVSR